MLGIQRKFSLKEFTMEEIHKEVIAIIVVNIVSKESWSLSKMPPKAKTKEIGYPSFSHFNSHQHFPFSQHE